MSYIEENIIPIENMLEDLAKEKDCAKNLVNFFNQLNESLLDANEKQVISKAEGESLNNYDNITNLKEVHDKIENVWKNKNEVEMDQENFLTNDELRRYIDFMHYVDPGLSRASVFSAKLIASNQRHPNLSEIIAVEQNEHQLIEEEILSTDCEIDALENESIDMDEGSELEGSLDEKRKMITSKAQDKMKEMKQLKKMVQEYRAELRKLKTKVCKVSSVSQEWASPKLFHSQPYTDPQYVRNNENFNSQQTANSNYWPFN